MGRGAETAKKRKVNCTAFLSTRVRRVVGVPGSTVTWGWGSGARRSRKKMADGGGLRAMGRSERVRIVSGSCRHNFSQRSVLYRFDLACSLATLAHLTGFVPKSRRLTGPNPNCAFLAFFSRLRAAGSAFAALFFFFFLSLVASRAVCLPLEIFEFGFRRAC